MEAALAHAAHGTVRPRGHQLPLPGVVFQSRAGADPGDAGPDDHGADDDHDRGDVALQRALLPAQRALDEFPVRRAVYVLFVRRALLDIPLRRRHGPLAQVDDAVSRPQPDVPSGSGTTPR